MNWYDDPDSETLSSVNREPVGQGGSIKKHLEPEGGAPGCGFGGRSPRTKVNS